MTRFLLAFACSCLLGAFSNSLSAQVTVKIHPDTSRMSVPDNPPNADNALHGHVQYTGSAATKFSWTRNVISLTPGCQTQVCDRKACYTPTTGSRQFDMAPSEDTTMDVHCGFAFGAPPTQCCAVVVIHVEEVGVPTNFHDGVYIFQGCVSPTVEAEAAKIQLFPNPVSEYFTLENGDLVKTAVVYGYDGRVVKTFENVLANATYSLSEIPAGNYVLVLKGEGDALLKAVKVEKK